MRRRPRGRTILGLAALAAMTMTVQVPAATAAADPLDPANFELRPNKLGGELGERVAQLDEQLPKVGVADVLADANRQASIGEPGTPCNSDADPGELDVDDSFCFNPGDADTTAWYPQGVTSSADAQADHAWGDNQALLVTWYDHDPAAPAKGVRVTFVDKRTGKSRHVLLAYPKINSYDNPTYESMRVKQEPGNKSLHGGGAVWYGNFLYVADTARGFRVFDMRHIYDLGAASNGDTDDADRIGRHDGVYYGHQYRYVMPQVASWTVTADRAGNCTADAQSLTFSHTSLDRSGTDHIVAGEYCKDGNGRVAAWPIAGAVDDDGEQVTDTDYRWQSDAAHTLPTDQIQGAARFDGRWYLSRSNSDSKPGTLYTTEPATGSTTELTVANEQQAAYGPEDLAHWHGGSGDPSLGQLWTVSEHPGKRMLYATGAS